MIEIPGYTITTKLAEGACAEIYAALEQASGRLVVIKILHPHNCNNRDEQKRLVEEGQLWLRFGRHENIVQTFRVGTLHKLPFLVQEYINGLTLREILKRKKLLPEVELLKLTRGLCRALHFIHDAGVVHKDIKPDNVMVTQNGLVKVLDFGFAEMVKSFKLFGRKLEGSPPYMAPELFATKKASVSTDVYAVGCTLYEMASGAPPYAGRSNNDTIAWQRQMALAAAPLRGQHKHISAQTEKIILTACQKDPAKRYKSVDEMMLDLARHPGWAAAKDAAMSTH